MFHFRFQVFFLFVCLSVLSNKHLKPAKNKREEPTGNKTFVLTFACFTFFMHRRRRVHLRLQRIIIKWRHKWNQTCWNTSALESSDVIRLNRGRRNTSEANIACHARRFCAELGLPRWKLTKKHLRGNPPCSATNVVLNAHPLWVWCHASPEYRACQQNRH